MSSLQIEFNTLLDNHINAYKQSITLIQVYFIRPEIHNSNHDHTKLSRIGRNNLLD